MLKCRLYAILVLVVALQAEMLSAQQLIPSDNQPVPSDNQPGQSGWTVERLPQVPGESPQPELVEYRVDPQAVDIATANTTATATTDQSLASGLCDFWGYRYQRSSLDWIVGNGNQFGMFSLNSNHYQQAGMESGFGVGLDFHFVSGPVQTEMPPRFYDFSLAYQCRHRLGVFAYDVAASVMASSDFEGSAREGIRYPSHAVGYLKIHPAVELVFGVDYLDRGDIKLLPVAGLIWIPSDDVRLELVFPRPRATFALPMFCWPEHCFQEDCNQTAPHNCKEHRLYIAGDLGGGTWAVERGGMYDDLATYRDLRLSVGLECIDQSGSRSAIEVSYLFERRLIFTSGDGNMNLDDTAMISWISSY